MNKSGLLIFIKFVIILPIQIQVEKDWQTYYEGSGKKRTPSYAETVRFARELAAASAILHYKSIGKIHQERDIPLLILDGNGNFSPEKVKASGKTVLLIQSAIHPGEPAGKDGSGNAGPGPITAYRIGKGHGVKSRHGPESICHTFMVL